jgi:hypothetical protein
MLCHCAGHCECVVLILNPVVQSSFEAATPKLDTMNILPAILVMYVKALNGGATNSTAGIKRENYIPYLQTLNSYVPVRRGYPRSGWKTTATTATATRSKNLAHALTLSGAHAG